MAGYTSDEVLEADTKNDLLVAGRPDVTVTFDTNVVIRIELVPQSV